ncbi:hypothetical protein Y032_0006g2808 [Ancylostoma ceylanicum]|uniref:Uncharacterized protein n=1 Tax=Ancylostoma ceylanicum TaxID=53326 RepID=A0A016VQ32_9BILA|nr:hypothetical protein Y032_0006g2808 [Ancylostoma ceylanicum]
MIVGGAILAGIFSLNHSAPELTSLLNTTSGNAGHAYRQFSDMEIRMMYGAFTAVTLCANLILALTPSREIPDCIEGKHNKLRRTFKEELGEEKMYFEPKKLAEIDHCAIADMVLAAFLNKRMIALSPLFLHLGFYGSFWICVYPTTLVFTKSLSNHIYLPAFYSLTVGTGEVVMGVIISTLSKRIKDFGLKPTMYCAFGLTTVILAVMVAAVPKSATVGLTDEPAWLVQPSVVLSVFTAFLIGLADSAANNVRTVICALAMIVGGAILAGIFSLNHSAPELSPLLNTTSAHAGHAYRQFSDMEIRMMYGAFTAVTLCANLIFALAPSREIPDCIEGKHNKLRRTFKEELDMVLAAFVNKRMIALSPLFLHLGFYTSFWVCVYPTTLVFTKSLSNHIYLPAFYSLTVGTGEVVMGIIISTLSKRIKDFGLKPTMFCGFGLTSVILAVMVAAVPKSATVGLTDEPAWLVQPSVVLSVFTAFLIGLADSCVNNVRTVICALALPDHRAQAFAISKFYQAFAGTILMFLSPYLSIYHYSALLFFTLCLSTSCFVHVAGRTKRMERESIRQYLDAKDVLPEKY